MLVQEQGKQGQHTPLVAFYSPRRKNVLDLCHMMNRETVSCWLKLLLIYTREESKQLFTELTRRKVKGDKEKSKIQNCWSWQQQGFVSGQHHQIVSASGCVVLFWRQHRELCATGPEKLDRQSSSRSSGPSLWWLLIHECCSYSGLIMSIFLYVPETPLFLMSSLNRAVHILLGLLWLLLHRRCCKIFFVCII